MRSRQRLARVHRQAAGQEYRRSRNDTRLRFCLAEYVSAANFVFVAGMFLCRGPPIRHHLRRSGCYPSLRRKRLRPGRTHADVGTYHAGRQSAARPHDATVTHSTDPGILPAQIAAGIGAPGMTFTIIIRSSERCATAVQETQSFWRYAEGLIPLIRRNTVAKCCWLSNPTANATSRIDSLWFPSSAFPRSMRSCSIYL